MTRLLFPICLLATLAAADPRVEPFIDGSKKSSPLNTPFGIEFDDAGNAYIVELDGGRIHQRTKDGELKVISGDGGKSYKGDGGPAKDATFNGMHNLAVTPGGDLYIADTWNNVIRRIDRKTGHVSTVAGTGEKGFAGDGGPAVKAKFNGTFCVALSPGHDKLIITDLGNKRVRLVDLATGLVDTAAGNGKGGVPKDGAMANESPLADPRAAVMDGKGNLYILDRGGHALRVVGADGKIKTVAGATGQAGKQDGPAAQSTLNGPKHLCADREGNILIADAENHLIRRYDAKTGLLSTLPITGLARPHGVTVTKDGTLYIVDSYNHRVLRCSNRHEPRQ